MHDGCESGWTNSDLDDVAVANEPRLGTVVLLVTVPEGEADPLARVLEHDDADAVELVERGPVSPRRVELRVGVLGLPVPHVHEELVAVIEAGVAPDLERAERLPRGRRLRL